MSSRHFCIAAALLAAFAFEPAKAAPPGTGVTSGPIALADAIGNLFGLSVTADGAGGWKINVVTTAAAASPGSSAATPSSVSETPTAVAANAIAPQSTGTATNAGIVLKNSPGNLYDGSVISTAAANLAILDAAAIPTSGATLGAAGGALLKNCLPVPVNTVIGVNYVDMPRSFANGITLVLTTVAGCQTYTPSATGLFAGGVK